MHVSQAGAVAEFWLEPVALVLRSWRRGVASSNPSAGPRAIDVVLDDDSLTVALADGRRVTVPLAWFPRLLRATPEQRRNWRWIGDVQGIHWPDIDEDLSIEGLLRGPASEASKRAI
jgi:hypothetical protein